MSRLAKAFEKIRLNKIQRGFARYSLAVAGAILPVTCLCCGSRGSWSDNLCPYCWAELPRVDPHSSCRRCGAHCEQELCGLCATQPPAYDEAVCALHYHFTAKMLLKDFKFSRKLACSKALGAVFAERLLAHHELSGCQQGDQSFGICADSLMVVPVPLTPARRRERGFNQSEILADELAKRLSFRVDRTLVRRVRFAQPQSLLQSTRERERNVSGAFSLSRPHDWTGCSQIALVDDVLTTGATANALCQLLRANGFDGTISVWCAVRADFKHLS